jgi:signal transduction histidine kinase
MREEPDEQRREKLAIIESQIERIIETIRGVLDRTRGHAAPHRLVAIDEVIDQVGQALSPQIMEKAIELRIEMPDDPPTIHTDFIAIRQTLINLLSNAIDATPESGTITIEVIVNTDESCLDLTIADTGPGVPAVERERIFDPLYTTKGDGDGTGLGLSIVQWLVRDLGGAVSLDENVECGAVFRVRLPLRD